MPRQRSTGPIGRWWWTVDRMLLGTLCFIMFLGAILVFASSPAVAERIHLDPFHFVRKQYTFIAIGLGVMVGFSFLNIRQIQRISLVGFLFFLLLLMLLPFVGVDTKGSIRQMPLFGESIQPSEFLKPFFAIAIAWIFAVREHLPRFPAYRIAILLLALVAALLLIQPDFGMTVTFCGIWGVQLLLAGLPFFWIGGLFGLAVVGGFAAYAFLPHVTARIDRFLDPQSGDNYQVEKSLQAFHHGGFFGRGPGEGTVKQFIPDAHTDFIFPVAAEEFGVVACLLIVILYLTVILRGLSKSWAQGDYFSMLAVAGLLTQFGVQALVNMMVTLRMLPAKGMTLPFISYGGSSFVAVAMAMGLVLALTRKRYGRGVEDGHF